MIKYLHIVSLTVALAAHSALAIESGESLYEQHCAACHGAKGSGGVGVPLALADFQSSVSDAYLAKTIQYGRKGRVMPAFSSLSSEEITALVGYIRSFSDATPMAENNTPIHGNVVHGGKLFAKHCASCHGTHGEGGKGTGVTMSRPRSAPIIAPALNNPGFLASASDQLIKTALIKGRASTPMVSFLKQGLSEQDINDIVAYVRSFAKSQSARLSALEDEVNIIYDSPYSFDKTVDNIKKAAVGKNFRIIRQQYFQDGFVKKGKENQQQTIIYFCNFNFLNDSLALDPRVGLFLPCRITILEHQGQVKVMSINPLRLSRFFNNDELDRACKDMRKLYEEILEEATL